MRKPLALLLLPAVLSTFAFPVLAAENHASSAADLQRNALLIIGILFAAVLTMTILFAVFSLKRRKKGHAVILTALILTTLVIGAVLAYCGTLYYNVLNQAPTFPTTMPTTMPTTAPTTLPTAAPTTEPTTKPTTEPTTEPTEPSTEDPRLSFAAVGSPDTDPANWNTDWDIIVNGQITNSYQRQEPITFGDGSEYFALPGIPTFRGNNYRNTSSYGTAEVEDVTLTKVWSRSLDSYNGWSGSGWTGQPLLVQWDEATRQIMNLYDEKKDKDGLVEVIYATLDGYIHFYDLEDGTNTRDPIWMGQNFKGAGAVDPRGYPLLYVGGGIRVDGRNPSMHVVSLIDGSILYKDFSYDEYDRRGWTAFDSSPLVDAETDTLIWPCENGLLYTIKLNTSYDKDAGTISVNPDPAVKTRYTDDNFDRGRYLGYESSVSIVDHWMYLSENGGMFHCIDINTMELVWAQDTKDDSNSSPVFEWDDEGNGYLYTAPSLHWTAYGGTGTVSVYKLDASTGEILWEVPFECYTVEDLSGGVQSTPLLGREGTEIEGMIIYSIARCPNAYDDGRLVALDTETGQIIWEADTGNYCWSSPTAFYTDDGRAYIFSCDRDGDAKLYDGATGERLCTISLGSTCEASPVVFNDMLIIGTRGGHVFGIRIS